MSTKITFTEPDSCKQCGWKPALRTNENQVIAIENQWLHVAIPYCVLCLFVCPKCQTVRANKNAVDNIEILNKAKTSKIIRPDNWKGPLQINKTPKIIH